jgi:hypothetical protein
MKRNGAMSARRTKKRVKAIGGASGVWVRKKGGQILKRFKKNPGKSVRLSNFTGTVKKLANGTVSIVGRAKRKRNPSKTSARRRVSRALTKYVRGQR